MTYQTILIEMESKRQVVVKKSKNCFIVGAILLVINLVIFGIYKNAIAFSAIISFIAFGILLGITLDASSKYRKYFKQSLMPLLVEQVGKNEWQYDYKKGISETICMSAKLFKRPDRYFCEDLLTGKYEDITFMTSDVRMQERQVTRDSKGRTRVSYRDYFTGRWFIYDFNKTFNGIIQVREEGLFEGPSWGLNIKKVNLEDVEFNKKFNTYATNQHDAFYVLTPTLMINIKKLERRYPGKIYFSFIGTKLFIAINGAKNSFEAPIYSPITEQFVEEQIADLMIIQEIVHELRLNIRIFK